MGERFYYMVGMSLGSFIGGFIPNLWGASMMSFSGIFFSAVGGIVGIWLVYKMLG